MPDKTMLIVDDVGMNHEVLAKIFEDEYELLHAYNGQEALDLLDNSISPVTIILLDIFMPVLDGFAVLEELSASKLYSAVPVIVLTASDSRSTELKALKLGACDLVTTPVEPELIRARVRNIVSRREYDRMVILNSIYDGQRKEVERQLLVQFLSRTVICEHSFTTNKTVYSVNISEVFAGEYSEDEALPDIWLANGVINEETKLKLRWLMRRDGDNATIVVPLTVLDGTSRWHCIKSIHIKSGDGGDDTLLLKIDDINSDILYQQQLSSNSRILNQLGEALSGGLVILNHSDLSYHYVNDNVFMKLGYTYDGFMKATGGKLTGLISPSDASEAEADIRSQIAACGDYRTEYRIRDISGNTMWILDTGRQFVDIDGVVRITSIITDITALKNSVETLKYQAEYDHLTGIFNKDAFYRAAGSLISENSNTDYAIVCVDVEKFKVINDVLGVRTGDKLLRNIADELRRMSMSGDTAAGRIGSDIFAVCMPDSDNSVSDTVNRLKGLSSFGIPFSVKLCFGVYRIIDRTVPVNLMCDRAVIALNSIKGSIIAKAAFYDENMRDKLLREQEIISEMHAALDDGQFVIYYQPQYNYVHGRMIGAEALVRWQHPKRGLIMPSEFIPVFEKNGFITRLDEYVWEGACRKIREWIDSCIDLVPISVNISRIDFYNPGLCGTLMGLVHKYSVPIDMFKLEITETAYTDNPSQLISVVERLRSLGFTVEMDDFGSGYSSLNTLKDVPVDVLKIDMRFLTGQSERGGSILNSVVRMAKQLRLDIIAEGVETAVQAEFLKSIGCPQIQGYLYSKPVSDEEFEKLLMQSDTGGNESADNLCGRYISSSFWNPNTVDSLIFNEMVGAAAVFEEYNGTIETLRANDSYYKLFGLSQEERLQKLDDLRGHILEQDREVFTKAFADALVNGRAECEIRSSAYSDSRIKWYRIKIIPISAVDGRYDFFTAFEELSLSDEALSRDKSITETKG